MKNILKPGDKKKYTKKVDSSDTVIFPAAGPLHNVYSSYSLARDAEWACRLFVLEMKEDDEEGIGTMVSVLHQSPVAVGAEVVFTSTVKSMERNEIICTYEARVGERVIATGETGQKILKKEKLEKLFNQLA